MKILKILFIALITFSLLTLTGCISTSGETEYSLKPMETSGGELVCCEAHVFNTKDYKKLKFKFTKNADGSMTVTLDEEGVSASDPAMVQAENNAKLLDAVTSIIPKANN